MNGGGVHTIIDQCFFDFVAESFRLAEDNNFRNCFTDRTCDTRFIHVVHRKEQVMHRSDSVGCRINRNFDRVAEIVTNEMPDVAIKCRREQHRLRTASAMTENPLNLRGKAVIGHAVCLVKTHDLDVAEIDFSRLNEIDQSQRCRHDQLNPTLQVTNLMLATCSAIDGGDSDSR